MSLADRLASIQGPVTCKIGAILSSLDGPDRVALAAALSDAVFPGRQIVAALCAEGHRVSRTTVQDHRNGVCCCAAR